MNSNLRKAKLEILLAKKKNYCNQTTYDIFSKEIVIGVAALIFLEKATRASGEFI